MDWKDSRIVAGWIGKLLIHDGSLKWGGDGSRMRAVYAFKRYL